MDIQGRPIFSELSANFLMERSDTLSLHERKLAKDEILPCKQDEDRTSLGVLPACIGVEAVVVDPPDGKLTYSRGYQVEIIKANEEGAALSEPSPSLASFRTVSTELYIPPDVRRDELLRDGSVSSLANKLQAAKQSSSPEKKMEDGTRDKTSSRKRSDSSRRHNKRRKRNQAELAAADVEAAIAMVVSAAEAVVVGNIMDASSMSSQSLGQFALLEAALSLGKARQLCGLNKYELNTTTMDSEEVGWQDLDHHSMQEAYADVGLIPHVVEDEKKGRFLGPELVNLPQEHVEVFVRASNKKDSHAEKDGTLQTEGETTLKNSDRFEQDCNLFKLVSSYSEVKTGVTVAEVDESKGGSQLMTSNILQERNAAGNERKLLCFDVEKVRTRSQQDRQFPAGSVCKIRSRLDCDFSELDGQLWLGTTQGLTLGGQSAVEFSFSSEAKIGQTSTKDHEFNEVHRVHDTEVLEDSGRTENEREQLGVGIEDVKHCQQHSEVPSVLFSLTSSPGGSFKLDEETTVKCGEKPIQSPASADIVSEMLPGEIGNTASEAHETDLVITDTLPEKNMFCVDGLVCQGTTAADRRCEAAHQEGMLQFPVEAKAQDVSTSTIPADHNLVQLVGNRDLHTGVYLTPEAMDSKEEHLHPSVEESFLFERELPVKRFTAKSFTPYVSRWFGGWTGKAELKPAADVLEGDAATESISSLCDKGQDSSALAATVEACARAAVNIIDNRRQADCQPADIAGQALPKHQFVKGDILQPPSTKCPHITRSPVLESLCEGALPVDVDQSGECDPETTTVVPDVNLEFNKKALLKRKGMTSEDPWMSLEHSDSPPLLWPRGKKRRLTACRIIDTDSVESMSGNVDIASAALPGVAVSSYFQVPVGEHHMVDPIDKALTIQKSSQRNVKSVLRNSTQNVFRKPCHDPKVLFRGLQFLLTGFNAETKRKLTKRIEHHGGTLLLDAPVFSPKQRFKRRGVDCGARDPPIVIALQQVRTPKFLYGCAVGSPLLRASWIGASVSSIKCVPYHRYQHKQTRASPVLETQEGSGVAKSSESPLFVGLQFHFYGQQDFVSQFSNLAKHAGGKVIHKLMLNGSAVKKGQKMVGVLVVEASTNVPLDLRRTAVQLEVHVVDVEWVIGSLLCGKLQPFPTRSTALSCVKTSQQSSSVEAWDLQRCSRQRRVLKKPEGKGDRVSVVKPFVKNPQSHALPEENGPTQEIVRANVGSREAEQSQVDTWLGKGFTSPPQVPELADCIMGPYSHALAHRKLSRKFLYYEAVLYNGVKYFLGDIVEVRTSTAGGALRVARIEGMWCEEGRPPQTRAFPEGVRKKAFKNVVLHCRRLYRSSETGFPGRGTNELYLSNSIDNNISISDIVRRVRVSLEIAGNVVNCNNWYKDQETAPNYVEQVVANCAEVSPSEYRCQFFYDHVRESLHRIKVER